MSSYSHLLATSVSDVCLHTLNTIEANQWYGIDSERDIAPANVYLVIKGVCMVIIFMLDVFASFYIDYKCGHDCKLMFVLALSSHVVCA